MCSIYRSLSSSPETQPDSPSYPAERHYSTSPSDSEQSSPPDQKNFLDIGNFPSQFQTYQNPYMLYPPSTLLNFPYSQTKQEVYSYSQPKHEPTAMPQELPQKMNQYQLSQEHIQQKTYANLENMPQQNLHNSSPPSPTYTAELRSYVINSYLYGRYPAGDQPNFVIPKSSYPPSTSRYAPSSAPSTVQNVADSSTDLYTTPGEQQAVPTFYPPVLVKGGGKMKKKNTEFSQEDIKLLEHAFSVSDFARGARRDEIARQLNVRPRSVTIWFQNKRAKLRAQSQQLNLLKKAAETGVVQSVDKIPDFR